MTDLIGIATWNFKTGTLAERIERFAAMGYNAMSLNMRDARALALGDTPDVEAAIVNRKLPITIHGGLAAKGEPIPVDDVTRDINLFLDWHSRTGLLVSINFDAPKMQNAEGVWEIQTEAMIAVLARMLELTADAGVTIGIEDWPRTPKDLKLVDDLRKHPHYGVLIDLGHLNMRISKTDDPDRSFSIDAARQYLESMQLPVNELHIHNNNGHKDLHAPPTVGTCDMPALASLLFSMGKPKSRGSRCVSTIELVPAWCGLTEEEGFSAASDALGFWRGAGR